MEPKEKDNGKVSILIPVYNVEEYIEECLKSAINQTYKNLEIICVDDCGSDGSIKIVEDYAKKDERIKILKHKKNLGISDARNTAFKNATGMYIFFLDSDDFIDIKYIENMVTALRRNEVEVVISQNIIEYEEDKSNKQFWWKKLTNGFYYLNNDTLFDLPVMTWCKLYKKSFLDRISATFPSGLKHEDEYFDHTTLIFLEKVFIIDTAIYYYRRRNNSITGNCRFAINHYDMISITDKIYEFYKKNVFLNKYKINLVILYYHLDKHSNKEKFIEKLKILFEKIEKDVKRNANLYSICELKFMNNILCNRAYNKNIYVNNNNKYVKLFNFITLLKIRESGNSTYIKLFNFIPLLKIQKGKYKK